MSRLPGRAKKIFSLSLISLPLTSEFLTSAGDDRKHDSCGRVAKSPALSYLVLQALSLLRNRLLMTRNEYESVLAMTYRPMPSAKFHLPYQLHEIGAWSWPVLFVLSIPFAILVLGPGSSVLCPASSTHAHTESATQESGRHSQSSTSVDASNLVPERQQTLYSRVHPVFIRSRESAEPGAHSNGQHDWGTPSASPWSTRCSIRSLVRPWSRRTSSIRRTRQKGAAKMTVLRPHGSISTCRSINYTNSLEISGLPIRQ